MGNVINFATYRARNEIFQQGQARALAVAVSVTSTRAAELRHLDRALTALAQAQGAGEREGVAEWRDELDIMALHTDHFDIRERCKLALSGRRW